MFKREKPKKAKAPEHSTVAKTDSVEKKAESLTALQDMMLLHRRKCFYKTTVVRIYTRYRIHREITRREYTEKLHGENSKSKLVL